MEGVRIIFILSFVFWINKEGRAVEHNSEKRDMGVTGHLLSRNRRSAIDCPSMTEIDGPDQVYFSPDVLCNISATRIFCKDCDNKYPSKISLKLNGTSEGMNLTYYIKTSTGSVNRYIGCEIHTTVDKVSSLSCNYFDEIPCEEELDSCHLCYGGTIPRFRCQEENNAAMTSKEIAGIIGAVVGVVIIVVAIAISLWCKRRQQRPPTAESISNNMKDIVHKEMEDISDDESLPDAPQDADQSQSVNQYESVTELGTRQFHKRIKQATNDDYTYIHDRDLEWKNKIRKGQPAGVFPINQTTKSNCLEGNENDAYNRLGDSQPHAKATTKSSSARQHYNHLGNTNDAYNHASDSTDSVARDIYNRLGNANEDTYNHAGDSVHDPEVKATYNHAGDGKNFNKESDAQNRGGDANHNSKATDGYHRLGGVAQVGKTSAYCSDIDDGQNVTDAYYRLEDENEEVNESDTYNHCEGFNRISKSSDTYNRLNGVDEDTTEPDTYNTTRGDIPVSQKTDNYNHIDIDREVVKETDNNKVDKDVSRSEDE